MNTSVTSKDSVTRPASQPTAPTTDLTPKITTPAIPTPAPRAVGEPSLFAQALAEATDGDGSEALARAAQGGRRREEDGIDIDQSAPEVSETVAGSNAPDQRGRKQAATPDNPDDSIIAAMRRKPDARKISPGEVFAEAKKLVESVAMSHDKLMLQTMDKSLEEISTSMQSRAAEKLSNILSHDRWVGGAAQRKGSTAAMILSSQGQARVSSRAS